METLDLILALNETTKILKEANHKCASDSLAIWRLTDHAEQHIDKQIRELLAPAHDKDSDCTLDPETQECIICGVWHGDNCVVCNQRGFHGPRCQSQRKVIHAL